MITPSLGTFPAATSINGAFATASDISLTYSVNADCTGSGAAGPRIDEFVIIEQGRKIFTIITKHGRGGVPLHVHHSQDELWYIFEGETLFQIGNKRIHAKAGDSVFGPRVPHSFMEEFFHELAQIWPKTGGAPPREVMSLFSRRMRWRLLGLSFNLSARWENGHDR